MRVPEPRFRASQVCRVLGSPIAFEMTAELLEAGSLTLSELVRRSRRSKSTACYHLAKLRLAQVVRYENRDGETVYWIKHPPQVRALLRTLDGFVAASLRADRNAT